MNISAIKWIRLKKINGMLKKIVIKSLTTMLRCYKECCNFDANFFLQMYGENFNIQSSKANTKLFPFNVGVTKENSHQQHRKVAGNGKLLNISNNNNNKLKK